MGNAETDEPFWPGWRELTRVLLTVGIFMTAGWLIFGPLTSTLAARGITRPGTIFAFQFAAVIATVNLAGRFLHVIFGARPANSAYGLGPRAVPPRQPSP